MRLLPKQPAFVRVKNRFGQGWLRTVSRLLTGLMLGIVVCFFIGCRPAAKPVVPEAAAPATPSGKPPLVAAAPPAHEPIRSPTTGNEPAPQTVREMEKVLVGFMISQHRRPQSFEEFVAATKIQVPPPPPGKKYVIGKNMHILIVAK